MEAMKASMLRDGFLAPVLLRPMGDDYEVVSGNHRVMAARELGMTTVPALIMDLTDQQVGRIAINLNTVHGDPTAELPLDQPQRDRIGCHAARHCHELPASGAWRLRRADLSLHPVSIRSVAGIPRWWPATR